MIFLAGLGVLFVWLLGLVVGAFACASAWPDELGGVGAMTAWGFLYLISTASLGIYILFFA